ncbi:MAG: hypothetical protein NO516_01190, partial [Candidatus Methanomethylicia archaeon]|nr:hypothetical protein [Candidatus Methanomethylicia archaeon]
NFDERFQRAIRLYNDENYSGALNEINAALDAKADSAEAYFCKGLILQDLKNYRAPRALSTTPQDMIQKMLVSKNHVCRRA